MLSESNRTSPLTFPTTSQRAWRKQHTMRPALPRERTSKAKPPRSVSEGTRVRSQQQGKLLSLQNEGRGHCQRTAWDRAVRPVSRPLHTAGLAVWQPYQPSSLTSWRHSSPAPPSKFLSIWFVTVHRLRSDCADGNPSNRRRCRKRLTSASHSTQYLQKARTCRAAEPPRPGTALPETQARQDNH